MTISAAASAAEADSAQLDEPVSLHPDSLSEGVGDRDNGSTEQI